MTKSTAVAMKEEGQLPVSQAQLAQYAEDAGQGAEGIGTQDVAIPFLGHVQALSKQLAEGDPKYLPTAKIGTIFNTVTGETFDPKEGINVVVWNITKVVGEKTPKAAGGKFVATYESRAEAEKYAQRGNELLDGYRVFVLYETKAGHWSPAVLSMVTKSKVYSMRHWNSLMTGLRVAGPNGTKIQPPTFAFIYKLTSAQQTFTEGTSAVLKAAAVGASPDDVYQLAKKYRQEFLAGTVKIAKEEEAETGATSTQEDDDLPY
jgi:hypothetical protein